LPCLTEVPALI